MLDQIQLREFHIHYNIGHTRIYNIEKINQLNDIIRIYGRKIIYSIKFPFHNQSAYLIIRNSGHNDIFVVEFFDYYNQNVDYETNYNQQYNDFNIVMNLLSSKPNINSHLVQFIINPFTLEMMP
jgi:hypothetical protein